MTRAASDYYEIRAIPNKGYGCVALKTIERGTRILADDPLLVVPIADYLQVDIEKAFESLSAEEKSVYFSLHSGHGQDPKRWPTHIDGSVPEFERKRIREQHQARVGKEATLISIFQTNCMEMNKGAAIFPHAARFNHSCKPNACFTWNAGIGKETIHAMSEIQAGEEITLSYCDSTHDKMLRSWELKHYGIMCDCPACVDDNGSAQQSEMRRYRLRELDDETKPLRGAHLGEGAMKEGFVTKLLEMAALHQQEGEVSAQVANLFLDIALVCEFRRDFKMAALTAEKAVQFKRDAQGADYPDYDKYAGVLERIKAKLSEA
jgi:hypothetical protein